MQTASPSGTATGSAPVRRIHDAILRVGAQVRADVGEPVEHIISRARNLIDAGVSPQAEQILLEIVSKAEEVRGELTQLERRTADLLDSDPVFSRPAAHAPPPLTQALAGELSDLARQVDVPARTDNFAQLRPRLKRAARLANIWLSTTVNVETGERTSRARTVTLGPGAQVDALPPLSRAAVPSAVGASVPMPEVISDFAEETQESGLGIAGNVAARALAARVERLEAELANVRVGSGERDIHWRAVAHEMRNAAHAFLAWADLFRHSEASAEPWFAPLLRSAEALARRAQEGVDTVVSGTQTFEVNCERFDLLAGISNALELVRPFADSAGVTLAMSYPMGVDEIFAEGDLDRVSQILYNLLTNAVQATPIGGTVSVAVGADDRWAEVEVEDTGPGVRPELISRLFTDEQSSGSKEGLGVGLSLSRSLAVQMGGTVELRGRLPGAGACFVVRIPRSGA